MSKLFKTKYDARKRIFAVPGDREVPVRKARNLDGMIVVDETKEMFPLAEYINSFEAECNLETLLKRFQAGDLSVMDKFRQRTADDYKDLTNIPDNFSDMMSMVHDAHGMFDELPAEIKQKFGNNFETFASTVGSKEWMENMGYAEKDPIKTSPDTETSKAENTAEN